MSDLKLPKFQINLNIDYHAQSHAHWTPRFPKAGFELRHIAMVAMEQLFGTYQEALDTRELMATGPDLIAESYSGSAEERESNHRLEVLYSLELIKAGFSQVDGKEVELSITGVICQDIGAPREAHAKISIPPDDKKRQSEAIAALVEEFLSDHKKILREKMEHIDKNKARLKRIVA